MTEKNHPAPRTPRPSAGTRGPKAKPKSRGKRILFGFLRFVAVMMCLGIMAVSVAGVLLSPVSYTHLTLPTILLV